MTDFSDFADFLNREEIADKEAQNAKTKKLLDTRSDYDNLIRAVFANAQEYYQTILRPRRDLFLVFKKDTDTKSDQDIYFTYRVSIIAQDSVPLGLDLRYAATPYLIPGKITPEDWHANVAMQITTFFKKNTADTLSLVFTCRVWGEITGNLPVAKTLSLHTDKKRRLFYTTAEALAHSSTDTDFLTDVTTILTAFTPNVLQHRDIVWS